MDNKARPCPICDMVVMSLRGWVSHVKACAGRLRVSRGRKPLKEIKLDRVAEICKEGMTATALRDEIVRVEECSYACATTHASLFAIKCGGHGWRTCSPKRGNGILFVKSEGAAERIRGEPKLDIGSMLTYEWTGADAILDRIKEAVGDEKRARDLRGAWLLSIGWDKETKATNNGEIEWKRDGGWSFRRMMTEI